MEKMSIPIGAIEYNNERFIFEMPDMETHKL